MQYRQILYGTIIAAAMGLGSCNKEEDKVNESLIVGTEGSLEMRIMDKAKLKEIQAQSYKAKAPDRVQHWIDNAFQDAKNGEWWNSIETDLRIAEDYADGAGIPFKVDMKQLREDYMQGVKEHGKDNVQHWLNVALEDARNGLEWSHIETDLSIAAKYAQEANIKLEEVADISKIKAVYAANQR